MSKSINFKPQARLLLQLGDQLIRNESVALLEIIKNSYDACAKKVVLSMNNLEGKSGGQIIIEDDGIGMSLKTIENVWMRPGTDYKLNQIKNKISCKHNDIERLPIGEKGIGRFGVHKLGNEIELTSKTENNKEVYFKINWKDFEKDDLLENIKVKLFERNEPKVFTKGKTGTSIIIQDLKTTWTRGEIREIYRSVNSLSSPFDALDSFKVRFKTDKPDWLKGLLNFKDIEKHALYYSEGEISGKEILNFKYKFQPWATMTKLSGRKIKKSSIRMVEKINDPKTKKREWVDLDLNQHKIGKIKFKLLIFDRDSKVLSVGISDKKGFKDYLNRNGGVRVFRNGVRVYDYGEPGNDWLNLDIGRVNQPGQTISNNIVIGAIYIDRKSSTDLIEKTNREGFIENEAYKKFLSAVRFAIGKVVSKRNVDKDKVRKFYSPTSPSEPVTGNLNLLKEKISVRVNDEETRTELLKVIKDVEKDYESITQIYYRSSSAGLSLSIVIHEIEKIIDELTKRVEEISTDDRLKSLVKILHRTVGDYADVIKQSKKSSENIKQIIDQAVSNIQWRLKSHEVTIVTKYKSYKGSPTVRCSSNLVLSTLINLIDNSIWWMNYSERKEKNIYITLTDQLPGHLSIILADNGPGFTISSDDAIKPFISDKPGGMGLGLHLASEIMNSQKGKLIFPEKYEYDLPDQFKSGAIIQLAFKKN